MGELSPQTWSKFPQVGGKMKFSHIWAAIAIGTVLVATSYDSNIGGLVAIWMLYSAGCVLVFCLLETAVEFLLKHWGITPQKRLVNLIVIVIRHKKR